MLWFYQQFFFWSRFNIEKKAKKKQSQSVPIKKALKNAMPTSFSTKKTPTTRFDLKKKKTDQNRKLRSFFFSKCQQICPSFFSAGKDFVKKNQSKNPEKKITVEMANTKVQSIEITQLLKPSSKAIQSKTKDILGPNLAFFVPISAKNRLQIESNHHASTSLKLVALFRSLFSRISLFFKDQKMPLGKLLRKCLSQHIT